MRRYNNNDMDFNYDEEVNESAIIFMSFLATLGAFVWIVSYFV